VGASLALATVAIFVRSVSRVAELKGGFHSSLANNEVLFMILEGAMISIAILCLTILHPGVCFLGQWNETKWKFRRSIDSEMELISSNVDLPGKSRDAQETGVLPHVYSAPSLILLVVVVVWKSWARYHR
jgi:hypothetical protein